MPAGYVRVPVADDLQHISACTSQLTVSKCPFFTMGTRARWLYARACCQSVTQLTVLRLRIFHRAETYRLLISAPAIFFEKVMTYPSK